MYLNNRSKLEYMKRANDTKHNTIIENKNKMNQINNEKNSNKCKKNNISQNCIVRTASGFIIEPISKYPKLNTVLLISNLEKIRQDQQNIEMVSSINSDNYSDDNSELNESFRNVRNFNNPESFSENDSENLICIKDGKYTIMGISIFI